MDGSSDYAQRLEEEFKICQNILTAVGDETRQHLLCTMLRTPEKAYRVVELAEMVNLSRPAVSHHIQILRRAGVVQMRREGTQIYYYLDPDTREIKRIHRLTWDILEIMRSYQEGKRG